MDYPELEQLAAFAGKHQCKVVNEAYLNEIHCHRCTFHMDGKSYEIYVFDEYKDLSVDQPLLHLVLVLREFALVEESTDYLHWCTMQGVPAGNETMRQYYQQMVRDLPMIQDLSDDDEVETFVTDFDFELNAGAAQSLRLD